jgi:hypothetical protein
VIAFIIGAVVLFIVLIVVSDGFNDDASNAARKVSGGRWPPK